MANYSIASHLTSRPNDFMPKTVDLIGKIRERESLVLERSCFEVSPLSLTTHAYIRC